MTKRIVLNVEDPGHSWYTVSAEDLVALGIADKISPFSFLMAGTAYLEEDLDAGVFFRAADAAGWEIVVKRRVYAGHAPCRVFPAYQSRGAA